MDRGLHLDQLSITLDGAPVVAADARIAPGEVLSVMGPSGVGKSTLLAAITGTLAPAFACAGRVRLDGRDITDAAPHRRRVGILFQDDLLFPHLSVAGNLAFGLAPGGRRAQRAARIEEALSAIDLPGYGPRDPATLSGGQRARVALMRMLLSDPHALLLDEPFGRLDAALRDQMRALVFDTACARALPVVMVTHDAADAQAANGPVLTLAPPRAPREPSGA
ncbi:MAG: ATP-binding cassette domain-containing protein [Paracoccaceae bacterium]